MAICSWQTFQRAISTASNKAFQAQSKPPVLRVVMIIKILFNFFTVNRKYCINTKPLPVSYGDIVNIRFGNIQMHHHPIHLHGHEFKIVGADGFPIRKKNQIYKNTILVSSEETWDIEFEARNPGIWPVHCHMLHHVTNNRIIGIG